MSALRIKQGSTLLLTILATDASGAPIDLTAATLATQLRTAVGTLVGPVAITATGVPGQAIVQALAADTAGWPVGILRGDIRFTGSGITVPSQTFMLVVEQAITT